MWEGRIFEQEEMFGEEVVDAELGWKRSHRHSDPLGTRRVSWWKGYLSITHVFPKQTRGGVEGVLGGGAGQALGFEKDTALCSPLPCTGLPSQFPLLS